MTSMLYLRKTGSHNPPSFARILHSYCNAVKITDTRSLFLVAGTQRSPICTMRCRPSDANLLTEDLATIMPKVRTENSLRVVAGGAWRWVKGGATWGQPSSGDD